MRHHDMNAREKLEAAALWLSMQHEDLSYGLKSPLDAVKLWEAWRANESLPEFCDDPSGSAEAGRFEKVFRKALGYNPIKRARETAPLMAGLYTSI